MIASQPLLGGNTSGAVGPPLLEQTICPGLAALAVG
jgi:hypothetical protein